LETLLQEGSSPKMLSPLTLAFVGDGVYELLVREYLVSLGNCPVKKLNSRKVELVRCQAQAQALSELWPLLSQEEQEVALRGRNAHVGHTPKNASVADYHSATALEALFGYLYLGGETARLRELFGRILESWSTHH
jgi:ribonuclease-3 family protein